MYVVRTTARAQAETDAGESYFAALQQLMTPAEAAAALGVALLCRRTYPCINVLPGLVQCY